MYIYNLEEVDNERKKLAFKIKLTIVMIVVAIACFPLSLSGFGEMLGVVPFILIPAAIINGVLTIKPRKKYRALYKERVVKQVVNYFDPTYEYDAEGLIDSETFVQSGIFQSYFNIYRGDDLITGDIDGVQFKTSELNVQEKKETYRDGKRETTYYTVFKGLFIVADLNKSITGTTYILPDFAERLLGQFGKRFQKNKKRGELITFDDTDFEKEFVIHGTDEAETRRVVSCGLIEVLKRFRQNHKRNLVHLAIKEDKVYCAISFTKNLFEPRIFGNVVKDEDVDKMSQTLDMIKQIVKEINYII